MSKFNILYISSACSQKKFTHLFSNSSKIPGQQVQKYHRLIMEGLVKNGINITTITALPITRQNYSKKVSFNKSEIREGIKYNYLFIFNIRLLKNIFVFVESFIRTFMYLVKNKDTIVICDVLNKSVSLGSVYASLILRKKNIGIVTDIPEFLTINKKSFLIKINLHIIGLFKSYIFLTNEMDILINKKNVPSVIIEGQSDIQMTNFDNDITKKHEKKICIYAGGLYRKYGLDILVYAFLKANVDNSELHLYGSGDFVEEIQELANIHSNIKYFGTVENSIIISEEIKSTLLINPRPTKEEFTKYSFPSKNLEYMSSGTPVLTTNLSGMPSEYLDYVYIIKDETVEGLSKTIKNILLLDKDVLHKKGACAKRFVLSKKNNVVQAKKIINLIKRI